MKNTIKNTIIRDNDTVRVFLEGGLGNRMGAMIDAWIASQIYGVPLTAHWVISKHCMAKPTDLFYLPFNVIVYEHERYRVFVSRARKSANAYPGTKEISETGSAHFGPPTYFWSEGFNVKYWELALEFINSLKLNPLVKPINLNREIDAYAVRTLRGCPDVKLFIVPGVSFLTTDSEEMVKMNPHCINTQTVFGTHDTSENRSVAGIQEALSDWMTMFTARKIYYTSTRSSFTVTHEKVGIERERYIM